MPYLDKEKQRECNRRRVIFNRQEFFEGKSCVKCGSAKELELDHVNPREKTSHRIWSWSRKRREEEIVKCQILCKDCHLKKTEEERGGFHKHGTRRMYEHHGCRCQPCRDAHSASMREWRSTK
jgi:5-methylcytosine-specific restriction endonuclease McrA